MVFKNLCVLVLWMKVVSALKGLKNCLFGSYQQLLVLVTPCFSSEDITRTASQTSLAATGMKIKNKILC